MLRKLATHIEMSFDVSDAEKRDAMMASEKFEGISSALDIAVEHLDIIYNPFQKYEEIPMETIVNKRGAIDRYKRKILENFNEVKRRSLYAIKDLYLFSSDTHVQELINSFDDSVWELEKQINELSDVLSDYKSQDFRKNVLGAIDNIRKQAEEIESLIKERIIEYIDTNILAKSWMSDTDEDFVSQIREKVPLITELYDHRVKELESAQYDQFPGAEKREQATNPMDAQRMWYPDRTRS